MSAYELRSLIDGDVRIRTSKVISLYDASLIAKKSEDTVTRWAKRYGIGRQLHKGASWQIDPVGLAIVLSADADALTSYQRERGIR